LTYLTLFVLLLEQILLEGVPTSEHFALLFIRLDEVNLGKLIDIYTW
jgi:hypothetical protein